MKKGYTLVEMLAAITVMGILLIIAIPSARKILEQNKYRKYEAYKETLKRAAAIYTDSHEKDMFGDYDNGCRRVTYFELKQAQLIRDFQEKGVTCAYPSSFSTYVQVTKLKNKEYDYEVCMRCAKNRKLVYPKAGENSCDTSTCELEEDKEAPTIEADTFTWLKSANRPKEIKVTMRDNGLGIKKNTVLKYQFVSKNQAPNSSAWKELNMGGYKRTNVLTQTIKKSKLPTSSGDYQLVFKKETVKDAAGNTPSNDVRKEPYQIDDIKPTCSITMTKGSWTGRICRSTEPINNRIFTKVKPENIKDTQSGSNGHVKLATS